MYTVTLDCIHNFKSKYIIYLIYYNTYAKFLSMQSFLNYDYDTKSKQKK